MTKLPDRPQEPSAAPPPDEDDFSPASDRLRGAPAIAKHMGVSERVARINIDRGIWPVTREGGAIVGSKRALNEVWRRSTSGKTAA
jgi:hypothetical protein